MNIRVLFSDNEPCLLQHEFQAYLVKKGIQHYTTQTYSSEMNGVAENAIKHLVQRASAMMWTAKIPEGFWPEAIRTATYLRNRSPHKALGMTPYEAWHGAGKKPDLGHVRIFGCRCYGHVEKANRTKWESHTIEGVLLGYFATESLYLIYDVNKRVLLKKRDVTFFEGLLGHPTMDHAGLSPGFDILGNAASPIVEVPAVVDVEDDEGSEQEIQGLCPGEDDMIALALLAAVKDGKRDVFDAASAAENPRVGTEPELDDKGDIAVNQMVQMIDMSLVHQALKDWHAGKDKGINTTEAVPAIPPMEARYWELYEELRIKYGITGELPDVSTATYEKDPLSWKQAMISVNKGFWLRAALEEMLGIAKMATFDVVQDVPAGRRALATKWVWLCKRDDQGIIQKFKARWVARGDLQRKGVDYNETFAPVASLASLRIMLTVAASMGLCIQQMDVVSAFLNGTIDTLVFLRHPEGFDLGGYCCLNKSLYGLCQAARVWYLVLHEALIEIGFFRFQADLACWIRMGDKGFHAVIAHVDDTLLIGSENEVTDTRAHLHSKFKTKDMSGEMFIGLRLKRDMAEKKIYIDQGPYASSLLEHYGLKDCNEVNAPLIPGQPLVRNGEPLNSTEKRIF